MAKRSAARKTTPTITAAPTGARTRPETGRSAPAASNGAGVVSREAIAARAYDLYLARGGGHGHDVEDWLTAERQLRESARLAS